MIVYARFNSSRKPEYRLTTLAERESRGSLRFSKVAELVASRPFLHSLEEKYSRLNRAALPLRLTKPELAHEARIEFRPVDGESLATELVRAARRREHGVVRDVLERFRGLIGRFPAAEMTPSPDFVEIFGGSFASRCSCIECGLVDVGLDHVFFRGEDITEPTLIDYEWAFPFSVPRALVLTRALLTLFANYGPTFPNPSCRWPTRSASSTSRTTSSNGPSRRR